MVLLQLVIERVKGHMPGLDDIEPLRLWKSIQKFPVRFEQGRNLLFPRQIEVQNSLLLVKPGVPILGLVPRLVRERREGSLVRLESDHPQMFLAALPNLRNTSAGPYIDQDQRKLLIITAKKRVYEGIHPSSLFCSACRAMSCSFRARLLYNRSSPPSKTKSWYSSGPRGSRQSLNRARECVSSALNPRM